MAARRPPAVARVLERVTATIREHDLIHPGETVLVCVSGGPDSVCLLESLVRLRRLFRMRLEVFHFDHRLRADSATDALYVRRLAVRHSLPFHLRAAEEAPSPGESVEAWARASRLDAAVEAAAETGADRVADGHTRDDQAETILLALIRGWGLSGMGGIAPSTGRMIRPLLDVTRDEVEGFCRALRLRPRHDPMNDERSLLRNAIRLEVLPAIERATGRSVRDTFARTAGLLRQDADWLEHEAESMVSDLVRWSPKSFEIEASALVALPLPMRSRLVRRAFQLSDLTWTEETIDAVLDLAAGRPGRRRDLHFGLRAARDRRYVHVHGPSPDRIEAEGRGPGDAP